MKAAVLPAPNQPLTIEEVALTKPGPREVLLRTAFAGLCHSDLHFIEGLYPHPTPCVLGHESAGIVEAVGEGVTYVKPGDHVITCLSVFCGTCPQCVTGHPNLCENTDVKLPPGVSRRLSWKGGELMNQFLNLSSFGEQMLVHENSMVKIDPDIPLDRAALVGCGVMTGVGAVFNAAKVEPGATVAVIGCGGVGLSAVNGAALAGAERIIAIDTVASKLEIARELGATDTLNASNADPIMAVRDMTGGDDSFIVLKHVHAAHHPGECFDIAMYRRVRGACRAVVRDHFPHDMSVRMLLKPLGLGPRIQRLALPVITALARRVVP